jgi:hypothetical protein
MTIVVNRNVRKMSLCVRAAMTYFCRFCQTLLSISSSLASAILPQSCVVAPEADVEAVVAIAFAAAVNRAILLLSDRNVLLSASWKVVFRYAVNASPETIIVVVSTDGCPSIGSIILAHSNMTGGLSSSIAISPRHSEITSSSPVVILLTPHA